MQWFVLHLFEINKFNFETEIQWNYIEGGRIYIDCYKEFIVYLHYSILISYLVLLTRLSQVKFITMYACLLVSKHWSLPTYFISVSRHPKWACAPYQIAFHELYTVTRIKISFNFIWCECSFLYRWNVSKRYILFALEYELW